MRGVLNICVDYCVLLTKTYPRWLRGVKIREYVCRNRCLLSLQDERAAWKRREGRKKREREREPTDLIKHQEFYFAPEHE